MPDISMLDLRANLTDILKRAEQGETFTVNRFGTKVAMIVPASVTVAWTSTTDGSAHAVEVHAEPEEEA